jgi:amino acid adenylation domain-containing protein
MTVVEIISDALDSGVKLFADQGKLGFRLLNGGQLTDDLKRKIVAKKPELISYLSKCHQDEQSITPLANRDGLLPVSCSQQRTWFAEQYDSQSNQNLQIYTFEVKGHLEFKVTEQTLTEIVARHEILRTVYQDVEGTPFQRIMPPQKVELQQLDYSHLEAEQQARHLRDLVETASQTPFDLSIDQLLRACYIHLKNADSSGGARGVLLFTMHHIASDGWSMEVLIREFTTLYQSFAKGEQSPLEPLTVQYADYAAWQIHLLQEQRLSAGLEYWQKHLADAPLLHDLVLDKARPANKQYRGRQISTKLTASVAAALKKLAQQYQLTNFMLLHGALALVLARHSNCHDIVLGTPVANRQQKELNPLIGFFVNTLVLRVNTDKANLQDYFSHVRDVHLAAQSHQQVSLDKLIEHLHIPRNPAYTPLFQIVLNTNSQFGVNAPSEQNPLSSESLSVAPVEIFEHVLAKFDLDIEISLSESGGISAWKYDTALFEEAHIRQMNDHLCNLLTALAQLGTLAHPVSKLSMLSEQETTDLINRQSQNAAEVVKEDSIQQVFELQAEQYPDNLAVVFDKEQLTYRELNTQANQLAHYLITSHGVTQGALIGLCVKRDISMLVGMLAILKVGGAYVPLELSYPQERLNYLMDDAGLQLIITNSSLLEKTDFQQREIVTLDSAPLQNMPVGNVRLHNVALNNTAYLIYTSGSTGKPKGVLAPHSGVLRLLRNASFMTLDTSTRFLQSANVAFDAATMEIWGPLLNGGCCILYPGDVLEPETLSRVIAEQSVNSLWLTAGLFDVWSEHCEGLDSLRWVIAGGDVVSPTAAYRVQQSLPNVQVINGYGPTENTIFSCCFPLPALAGNETSIPIGYAIKGDANYVLDCHGQLAPEGVPGELHVSGPGLALGYLGRQELTEEKFLANPFYQSHQPDWFRRMYKTGDIVRYLKNDSQQGSPLEYVGRKDQQIKLRGFRIELGEIETLLAQHPKVNSCAVLLHKIENQSRLVAFVVAEQSPDNKESLDLNSALKYWLQKGLPDYMVPGQFTLMDRLPLTANGKLDKKALLELVEVPQSVEYGAPVTNNEILLCSVWQYTLATSRVGINDNFFDLGGDSISAMRLVYNIKKAGYLLEVKDIFKAQTPKEQAKILKVEQVSTDQPEQALTNQYRMPGNRYWYFDTCSKDVGQWGPAYRLEFTTAKNYFETAKKAANFVVKMHEGTRIINVEQDGERKESIRAFEDYQCFEYVDFRSFTPDEVETKIKELHGSIDLSQGMVKFWYCDLGENKNDLLVFATHHLAIEQYSRDILFADLLNAFDAFNQNKEPQLKRIGSRFSDWVTGMEKWLTTEEAKELAGYWESKLTNRCIPLPTDYHYVHERNNVGSSTTVSVTLNREDTQQLIVIAGGGRYNEFDLILTAVAQEVVRWTGAPDFICDVVTSGRDHFTDLDLSGTVGWLNEHISLLIENNDFEDGLATLSRSKQAIAELIGHAKGFSHLKYKDKAVIPEHDLSTLIRPDLLINYIPKTLSHMGVAFQEARQSEDGLRMLGMVPLFGKNRQNPYKIYCEVAYMGDQLLFNWDFSTNVFKPETIKQLAENSLQYLHNVIQAAK